MYKFLLSSSHIIGSDRKQFLSSDPTRNKNEFDPIQQKNEKLNLIQYALIQLG